MTERSDVVALEQILNYVAQEAQRLHLSPVVVHCLRMAAFDSDYFDSQFPNGADGEPCM